VKKKQEFEKAAGNNAKLPPGENEINDFVIVLDYGLSKIAGLRKRGSIAKTPREILRNLGMCQKGIFSAQFPVCRPTGWSRRLRGTPSH
jgi:hypothetical protein